jgi:alpha-D-ribose 1-methylphosphonate 5-triphosphate synthase subunit PhnH
MQREIQYDEIFDAQEHYRLLLDSMARPGKINVLPRLELTTPQGIHATGALVGFALLNSDVSFYVDGPSAEDVSLYLLVNTSARPAEAEEADYVYLDGTAAAEILYRLKTGTLPYPENSATVIAAVGAMGGEGEAGEAAGETGLVLTLSGPGVDGERRLSVTGLDVALLEALVTINAEFPLGIDLVLTDPTGRIACIPRSSRVRWDK